MFNFFRAFISSIFVTFRPNRLLFAIDTAQSSPSPTALILFVKYVCKSQKRVALLKGLFPYNHSINGITAGLNNTRQREFVKVKAVVIYFY